MSTCAPALRLARANRNNPVQCPFIALPSNGIANSGKSTIKGIEVDVSITSIHGLNLSASYACLDTKLKAVTLPATPLGFKSLISPVVGGRLPLTPNHKITVTSSYTLPLPVEIGAVSVAATFTYQSDQFGAFSSLLQFQTLPSQRLINLNLNWRKIAGKPIDHSCSSRTSSRRRSLSAGAGAPIPSGLKGRS